MEAKHTPGPWQISRDKRTIFAATEGAGVLIRGVEQTIPQIAHIIGNGFGATLQEQEANARLIAAAPELLEAAKAALALFDKNHALSRFNWGTSGLRAEDIRELNELPGRIHAAIGKAEQE